MNLQKITQFDEDMLVFLDRNFEEINQMFTAMKNYMDSQGTSLINLSDEFRENAILHGLAADMPGLGG